MNICLILWYASTQSICKGVICKIRDQHIWLLLQNNKILYVKMIIHKTKR